MEDNRKEVDRSGQEEPSIFQIQDSTNRTSSTIAEGISSANHTTPSSSAPPIEGRVQLSDDQRRESKKAADRRYNEKRKRKEDEMMEELEKLEEDSGKLELESRNLKIRRDGMEALLDEENNIILSQLVDNYAGQNTEVQKARNNFTGETSTGQDGLKQEMNPAPITSNADTISGENASMNLQTLPRSAQPAGSSGLPDDKQARKRISDKKHREKRKRTTNEAAARIKELKEKNGKTKSDNDVFKREANLFLEQRYKLRNIRMMAFKIKDASRKAKREKVLDGCSWMQKNHDELKNSPAYLSGKKKMIRAYMRRIRRPKQEVERRRQNATPVAGRTGFGIPRPFDIYYQAIYRPGMELGGPDIQESLYPSHEVERAHLNTVEQPALSNGGLAQGGDLSGSHGLNYTSPPRAAMASGSSPMQGSLAPGGQRNTVEQPALSYDGLAQGGGLLDSHGLCYTSPPGAAMASGSSPMQGSLAPGGQAYLSFEVTGIGTGETGLPVEDSPGLPQSELSQERMHLPSSGIGDQENTSFIDNLPKLSTSFSNTDWIEKEYNDPTRMP